MSSRGVTWLGLVGIWIAVSGTATVVRAAETTVVFGGALGASSQARGASDQPYLGPGFGGTAVSAIVFGDAMVRPTVSVGGEASLSGGLTGQQFQRVSGGANQLLSRHRDSIFSGVVKARSAPSSIVQLAAGGGIGLARRHTVRSGNFVRDFPPGAAATVSEVLEDNVVAFTGVVDASVRINSRLGLIALFRIYKLDDDDRLPDGVVKRGVSSVIARYAVGGQLRF